MLAASINEAILRDLNQKRAQMVCIREPPAGVTKSPQ
jgi:hypothetical protein